jgi:hypothetical protein
LLLAAPTEFAFRKTLEAFPQPQRMRRWKMREMQSTRQRGLAQVRMRLSLLLVLAASPAQSLESDLKRRNSVEVLQLFLLLALSRCAPLR